MSYLTVKVAQKSKNVSRLLKTFSLSRRAGHGQKENFKEGMLNSNCMLTNHKDLSCSVLMPLAFCIHFC